MLLITNQRVVKMFAFFYSPAGAFLPAEWAKLSLAVKLSGPTFKLSAADVSFTRVDLAFGGGPVYKVVESAVVGVFTPLHAANESDVISMINLGVLFFMILSLTIQSPKPADH
jgi:hypothetical protein